MNQDEGEGEFVVAELSVSLLWLSVKLLMLVLLLLPFRTVVCLGEPGNAVGDDRFAGALGAAW